jgi:hypothetical protein
MAAKFSLQNPKVFCYEDFDRKKICQHPKCLEYDMLLDEENKIFKAASDKAKILYRKQRELWTFEMNDITKEIDKAYREGNWIKANELLKKRYSLWTPEMFEVQNEVSNIKIKRDEDCKNIQENIEKLEHEYPYLCQNIL